MVDTIKDSMDKLKTNLASTSIMPGSFDRSKLATAAHPKSIAALNLHTALTNYFVNFTPDDKRNVSPQYRALEATFLMEGHHPEAPTEDGKDAVKMIEGIREGFDLAYRFPFPAEAEIESVTYGGVQCYWIKYPHMKTYKQGSPFIVYLHGGCFMFGSIVSHCGIAAHISKQFDLPLLYVEYPLAPPHLFPAQRDSLLAVHKALLKEDATIANRIITYGESAGGALSITYVQQALDNNLPVPRACIAVSPWADVTCSAPSYTANAKSEIMMSVEQAHWYIAQCCGGKDKVKDFDLTHGDYSCYKGTFQGFCPLYVVAGAAELLASDAELVNQAALNAKVDSTLVLYPHMCHNFQNFGGSYATAIPEAIDSMAKCVAWLRTKMNL